MNKERELLFLITKRFREEFNNVEWYSECDKDLIAKINRLLAEPEPENQFNGHFEQNINVYADKHPSRLVRQLASRLRDEWNKNDQEN